jgi:cyclohexa-1,5-dienecarbonyl-CoA hydratase
MTLITGQTIGNGGWQRIVLNAAPANVISRAMVAELRTALEAATANRDLKLLTIEGAGAHFSYGASVSEHLPPAVTDLLAEFHALIRALLDLPVATAAIVRGRCLGGGFELALACDFIFASTDAQMGVPEVTLGVFPPAAAALLPARVGVSKAGRVITTGETLTAAEWHAAGLVLELTAPERLMASVEAWFLHHLAPRSAVALRHAALASRAVLRALALPALDQLEHEYVESLLATHDGVEGVTAFVEKRPPVWTNR